MATYTFNTIPASVEEFKASPYFDLSNEHNTFAMFIVALKIYSENPELGNECIDVLRGPVPMSSYDKSFIKDRFMGKKYLANAYFEGATPANGYTPSMPLTIVTQIDSAPQYTAGEDYRRVFVKQDGFDNPRYATFRLKKSENKWFISEYSGILSGVKQPAAEDPWA